MSIKAKALLAVLVAAFLLGAGWLANGWRWDARLAGILRIHAEQVSRNSAAVLHRYTEMERTKDEAIQAHALLVAKNATAADAARLAADGLRRDLAGVPDRIATATHSAVREYAIAASDVLGQCAEEVAELARAADEHAADVRLMQEAWPK